MGTRSMTESKVIEECIPGVTETLPPLPEQASESLVRALQLMRKPTFPNTSICETVYLSQSTKRQSTVAKQHTLLQALSALIHDDSLARCDLC